MRTLEQIVEQIRSFSGADFAFVLTRKGRLVTNRAPRDMPEEGRARLVRAARPVIGTDRVVEVTLPREELVPYGGAAPVDVYVAVAAEQAIVCVVMATWADKIRVLSSISAGLTAIEPLLKRGLPPQRRTADVGPAKGSPFVGDKRTLPPPSFHPMALDGPSSELPAPPAAPPVPARAPAPAAPAPANRAVSVFSRVVAGGVARGAAPRVPTDLGPLPRPSSTPSIHVAEAELGRVTLAAIRHEVSAGGPSSPDITYGDAELGRGSLVAVHRELVGSSSAPEIVVGGEATLGRETLAAIDYDGKPRPASSPDAIRVELVSLPESELYPAGAPRGPTASRATVPWVELPSDTKRAADAAALGRNLGSPKVTLKLEEADEGVLEAAHAEMTTDAPRPRAPQATMAYEAAPAPPAQAAKR